MLETADLKQKIEGEEEVEKMDALLSLAVTGGDFGVDLTRRGAERNA